MMWSLSLYFVLSAATIRPGQWYNFALVVKDRKLTALFGVAGSETTLLTVTEATLVLPTGSGGMGES